MIDISQGEIQVTSIQQMIILNRGWGKTGPAHSFPPLLFSDLSTYLSVLRFNLLLHWIWTLMIDKSQGEIQVTSIQQMILLNRGWGKTGPAHSFPPLLFSNLSIYLSVLRFNLLLHCILTLMIVLS